jgi:E3 ubiquitin-protein ligase DOA10
LALAVFVSLFYPIIVLDLILIFIGWTLLGNIEGWGFLPVIWLFFVFAIDYLIIRTTWRAASR